MGTPANRIVSVQVTSSVELVTPELARQWRANSKTPNRDIADLQVEKLKRDIENGLFEITNQGIGIDVNGDIVDGHHRLDAIIASGRSVYIVVVRGLHPGTRKVVDEHRPRGMGGSLAVEGAKFANARVARVRVLANILSSRKIVISRGDFERIHEAFQDAISWSLEVLPTGGSTRAGFAKAPVSAALAFAYQCRQHRDAVDRFTRRVAHNDALQVGSPEHALHAYITTGMTGVNVSAAEAKRRASRYDDQAVVVRKVTRCVHAYVSDQRLAKLQDGALGLEYFSRKLSDDGVDSSLLRSSE